MNADAKPPAARALKANIAYAVGGNIAFNACRVLVVLLIANYASAEALGAFDASMAWSAPIVTFLMLQLRGAYVADTRHDFSFGTYEALRSVCMAIAAVVLAVLVVWHGFHQPVLAFTLMLAAVAAGKIVGALGEVRWGVFQQRERLELMGWSQVLRGVAMLAPFAVILPIVGARGGGESESTVVAAAAWAVAVYVAGWALVVAFFDRPRASALGGLDTSWTWPAVVKLARQTAPLGLVVLIISLCDSLPRLMIGTQSQSGLARLGYFSAMANIVLPLNLMVIAMGQAAANRTATYYRDNLRRFVTLAAKLLGVTALISAAALVGTFWIGEWVLRLLYPPEYADYFPELLLIVTGGGLLLLASLLGIMVTSMRMFWVQVPLQTLVLVATAVAAWLLIPDDPVRGGAWTFLVRSAAQFTLYGLVLAMVIIRAAGHPPTTTA